MDYGAAHAELSAGLSALEQGDYAEAVSAISVMEAYLPIEETPAARTINRAASRYVSEVSKLTNESYEYESSQDEFVRALQEAGACLRECMAEGDETLADDVETAVRAAATHVELTETPDRLPEDSAWGKMVSDIIS